MKCSVCFHKIHEKYCSHCGQYFKSEKVSFKSIFADFLGNVFSLEKSFVNNMKLGLLEPKSLILNYWNGYRGYYYSPSKFLVIASAFFLLQLTLFNNFLGIIVYSKFAQQFSLLIVLILLLAFSSFIVYLKYKKRFYEHLILSIYNVSLWSIIFVPISIILNILSANKTIQYVFLLLYIVLITIWNSKVFDMGTLKRFMFVALNWIFIAMIFLVFYTIGNLTF